MPLRFRRRIKLLPGVHLNVSRSGISTSVGMRGASVTFGKRGTYTNVGLPGTGISWRGRLPNQPDNAPHAAGGVPESVQSTIGYPKTHHLHWWTVILFFVAMIGAGATGSNLIIGIFWSGWLGYWFFLALRWIARKSNRTTM